MCLELQKPSRYPVFTFLRSSVPPFLFLKSKTRQDSKVGPSVEFVQNGKKHTIPVLSNLYDICSSVPVFLLPKPTAHSFHRREMFILVDPL